MQNAEYSLLLAWALGLLLVARTAGAASTARLSFPFTFPAIIFSLAAFTVLLDNRVLRWPRCFERIAGRWLVAVMFLGFAICRIPDAAILYGTLLPHDLAATLRAQPLFDESSFDAARRLQNAAPAGAPILARLAYPSILNFYRNPIYIIDWPGGYYVSPPLGMPFFQGPEALRRYLVSKGLRYVAWSYAAEANFPRRHFEPRLSDPDPLIRRSAQTTLDFQSNLEQLRLTSRQLFKDDQNALFDLALPSK